MVRKIKFNHNVVVTGSNDGTKQVSLNAWNDGHDEQGMTGHGTVTTLTVSSDTIAPIHDMHKLDGESASADDLATITNTDTAEFDEIWFLSGAQTITLINSGNIITLTGLDTILSTTVPTKLIRVGTSWYETGASGGGVFPDTTFRVQDDGDITKQMIISLGGATSTFDTTLTFVHTADRAITFPDLDTILMGKDTTDIFTNKSYDLGGTGNVLTGSTAEFNTALQSDSFFFISQNISNMATSTLAQYNTSVSDGTFAFIGVAQTWTANQDFNDNVDITLGTGADFTMLFNATDTIFNAVNGKFIIQDGGTAVATFDDTDGLLLNERLQLKKGTDEASNTELTLTTDGNVFDITGTTTIDTISPTNWQAGSVIHLHFTGVLTVTDDSGGTNDILLGNSSNMTTAVGDTLSLYFDGTDWIEISRSTVGAGGSDTPWSVNHDFDTFYYDMQNQTAPSNPATDNGRYYQKVIDANNDGLFVKIKKNNSFVEVQIA